jgi:autotransporter-associated beta strand protein
MTLFVFLHLAEAPVSQQVISSTMDTNFVNGTVAGNFWKGGVSNLWSGLNWSPDATGATSSTLASGADVVFSVTGIQPHNQNTVLDVDETISSLTVNDPVAVTISGPHTLSITGTGVGNGITINSGAGLVTINSNLLLSGLPEIITVNSAAGLVINGIVGGTIGLTKAGTGQLTLSGANTYTGGTTINAGTLQIGTVGALGSIVGAVINNGRFDIVNADTSGITAGTATITNISGGFTQFSNTSTAFAAAITNNTGGITRFNATSTAGIATITNNGGVTQFQRHEHGRRRHHHQRQQRTTEFFNTSVAGNPTIINNIGGSTVFFDLSSAGHATITNNAGGSTKFNATSTAGFATITTNSGGRTLFFDTSTGGNAQFITNPGGIFDISNLTSSGMTVGSIEGAGTYFLGAKALTVGSNNLPSVEVNGTIADGGQNGGTGGALIKVGTGTLILSGANTYTGGTTISEGTLQIGNGILTGSILGPVVDNGALVFDRLDGVTFGGVISGTGSLTQSGGSPLILTGDNTYAGGTTISAGKGLVIGDGGTIGSIVGNVTDNGFLTFNREDNTTFSGTISGTGILRQQGPGTLTLTGVNSYMGGTALLAGTLSVDKDAELGGTGVAITLRGGELLTTTDGFAPREQSTLPKAKALTLWRPKPARRRLTRGIFRHRRPDCGRRLQ